MIALPHHQDQLRRLHEIEKPLIDVEGRNTGWPAACLAIIDGLAADDLVDGFLQALLGEIGQIWIVDVAPPEAGWLSRRAVAIADMGMRRIVADGRRTAWDRIEARAASPAEARACKIWNSGLLSRCGFDNRQACHYPQREHVNSRHELCPQKSALIAVGIGSTRSGSVEKSKLPGPASAQDCSSSGLWPRSPCSTAAVRRHVCVTCSGCLKVAESSRKISACRFFPPLIMRKRSTTCSFSLCGVR